MTIEAVNQFLTKVNQDQKLKDELSQAKKKSKNDRQAAVELAAKHGYEFTPEELDRRIEQLKNIQAKQAANQELNESELEAVAGGACLGAPMATISQNCVGLVDVVPFE